MEILDFSLPTTLAKVTALETGIGDVFASHPDELKRGLSYHPMILGEDYLDKIGAISV